jgi:hypothetical protein
VKSLVFENNILLIVLVAHSSHLSQSLDLSVFKISKNLYKIKNSSQLSSEKRKLYFTNVFYFRTIRIPSVRFIFGQAGFIFKMIDNFGEIIIDSSIVLN